MKDKKWEVSFLDANRNKCDIDFEITYRNGYKEFTMSGDCAGCLGQCDERIKARTTTQKNLLELWDQYHLNGKKELPEDIEDYVEELIESIQEEEEERKGESLSDLTDTQLVNLIEEKIGYTGRDGELAAAFVKILYLCENDLEDIDINDNHSTIQGVDYIAGDDDEMDNEWDDYLERYIDECLEIPDYIEHYFDREKWKDDAKIDGRGHSLNSYNGCEESMKINGTWYYAYRN
jgi:hypothetical protein